MALSAISIFLIIYGIILSTVLQKQAQLNSAGLLSNWASNCSLLVILQFVYDYLGYLVKWDKPALEPPILASCHLCWEEE